MKLTKPMQEALDLLKKYGTLRRGVYRYFVRTDSGEWPGVANVTVWALLRRGIVEYFCDIDGRRLGVRLVKDVEAK